MAIAIKNLVCPSTGLVADEKLHVCTKRPEEVETTHLSRSLPTREPPQLSAEDLSTSPRKPVFIVPVHRHDMRFCRTEILDEVKLAMNTRQRRAVLTGVGGVG
jgi:hypothetical protein